MTKLLLVLVVSLVACLPAFAQNPDSIHFAPAVNYGVGTYPMSVFSADLDGDGDLDLAIANSSSNSVSILKNNGDGAFQPKVDYAAGAGPWSVFCEDLDGDNDLDLAVANSLSNNVSILKNNGDGTFQPKVDYAAGAGPYCVFCADLDGDLDLDLTVVNYWGNSISVLKNNGDGTFQTKVDYNTENGPTSVFCADLDGDIDLDLAVSNSQSDSISIFKNNGDGTFQAKIDYSTGDYPRSIFCADIDGDSDLDLVTANELSGNVSIIKNNGDGTFQNKADYSTGPLPTYIFCADLDQDSHLDLVVANSYGNNISILRNNGDGIFQIKVDYAVGDYPNPVFCADLDGDSDLDVAVVNSNSNNVSILKNLTVRKPVELWADIVGRSQIRVGQPSTYTFVCGNFGTSEVEFAIAEITISPGLKCLSVKSGDSVVWSPETNPDEPIAIVLPNFGVGQVHSLQVTVQTSSEPDPCADKIHLNPKQPDFGIGFVVMSAGKKFMTDAMLNLVKHKSDFYLAPDETYWQRVWSLLLQSFGYTLQDYKEHPFKHTFAFVANLLVQNGADYLYAAGWLDDAAELTYKWSDLNLVSKFFCALYYNFKDLYPPGEDWSTQGFEVFLGLQPVQSWDPNDKCGPVGYDNISHFVPKGELLHYVIFFENVDSATADAENIIIMDTLDQNLDWSTLQISDMSHPDPCTATFDAVNGIITWTCDSIMLPPDTLPPNGEGWVSFSIRPDSGLPSGTQIKNRASIKFDYNPWMYAPMDSSYIINTIDAERPTSSVNPLPDTTDIPDFTISWSGMDDPGGSGIAAYTIYAKTDGGSYLPWIIDTTGTSAFFNGGYGHTYYFSCTAIDNVGNREERHLTFDARTRVLGYRRGDVNGDGLIELGDVVYLISYLYKNGPAPVPLLSGDANCSGEVELGDVVYLITYLYKGGPPPSCK